MTNMNTPSYCSDHHFTTNGHVAPPATPLSRYFDPDTSVIYPEVMEPPFPLIPEMEEDCYSVYGDEDEWEWVDGVVDSVVKWVVEKVQEGPSSSDSTS